MTIKSRISRLEKGQPSKEAELNFLRITCESDEGDEDSGFTCGSLVWGYRMTAFEQSEPGESHEEFVERMEGFKSLSWEEAKAMEGLNTQ